MRYLEKVCAWQFFLQRTLWEWVVGGKHMKTPTIDWQNSSSEFIAAFRISDRAAVGALIIADVARAQRMAATGWRHFWAIT